MAPPAGPPAPAPAAAPPAPLPPRTGDLADEGAVVRPSVRARSWTLRGFGKVGGPVELDALRLDGDLAVAGSVRVDDWSSRGHVTVEGPAGGNGPWKIDGEHRFRGALEARSLAAHGRLDVQGPLTVAEAIRVDGSLDGGGDVQAAAVQIRGGFSVTGEIRAASVEIDLAGPSKTTAIRGDRVRVGRRRGRPGATAPTLELLEITAKEVELTGVVAEYVRADRISLGPGCRISRVDGSVVARDRTAVVGPQRHSELPKGLRR